MNEGSKKVLLVTRHFPPLVSGGARRPLAFLRALETAGYDVAVMSPAAPGGVHHLAVPHAYSEAPHGVGDGVEGAVRLRDHVLVPDADLGWAVRCLQMRLPFRPDVVVTTSPPESVHLVGYALKRRFGCTWLADFRDHWCIAPLSPIRVRFAYRRRLEQRLARWWLGQADCVIAAGEGVADEVFAYAPQAGAGMIRNTDLALEPSGLELAELGDEGVHIVHTGSFSLSDPGRRLNPVIDALEGSENPSLRLHLVGKLTRSEIARAESSSRAGHIAIHGPVPMAQARAFQRAADILLLVAAPGSPHLPGKLTEYRAAGKSILAIGPGPWAAEAGIRVTDDPAAVLSRLARPRPGEPVDDPDLNPPAATPAGDGGAVLVGMLEQLTGRMAR